VGDILDTRDNTACKSGRRPMISFNMEIGVPFFAESHVLGLESYPLGFISR